MNCPDMETIERFIVNDLQPEEHAEFESHLQDCGQCQAAVVEANSNEDCLTDLKATQGPDPEPEPAVEPLQGKFSSPVLTVEDAQALLGERYHVVKKVGQTDQSDVFQAIDSVLERQVAIKFLTPQKKTGTHKKWAEARAMGRLNHPYIAQVYEVGQTGKHSFIIMEWIDGLPLAEAWEGLETPQRLRLFLKVLQAVGVAHARGVTHRDIKPSNILVTGGFSPKILDFGIAVQDHHGETREAGLFKGTPGYCAPEQVTPPVKVSHATDVYALGALLYQLLTDRLPFEQSDLKTLFEAIRTEYPEPPGSPGQHVPIALQNICLKALEKDPKARYANAQQLREELQRYLRGERIWSRPSYMTAKLEEELGQHREKLQLWRKNELVTQGEYDRLENIYERIIRPSDPSIMDARKLSLSQVFLYLGGWIIVLGTCVLFYKTWDEINFWLRPAPALGATLIVALTGVSMWWKKENRLCVGFLAIASLLMPVTVLLSLGQWNLLSADTWRWGTESVYQGLNRSGVHVLIGNTQLYVSSWCWLACSSIFLWMTRSSIFAFFSVLALLAILSSMFIINGLWEGSIDVLAAWYLIPSLCLFVLGAVLDRGGQKKYAWPLSTVGIVVLVASLTTIALSDNTLFGLIHERPVGLSGVEHRILSLIGNGLVYLIAAGLCRSIGTPLQRSLGTALNWLGALHVLTPLRILDLNSVALDEAHRMMYRCLLPVASLFFVLVSVTRQMKSFFYSGLAGITASVHKLTVEHLDKFFLWPLWLIVTGTVSMFIAWLIPRWRANVNMRRKGEGSAINKLDNLGS
ncbi:MAG: DUF2157 domain-containing protein [Planctomycetes bacterium]|nr:DUF2157 domain-containing protein [Planctomycetota bacterium]